VDTIGHGYHLIGHARDTTNERQPVEEQREKRGFGQVRKLPSGRYQARYTGPDGLRHTAPSTYEDRDTALLWLKRERALVESPDTWEPPKARLAKSRDRLTFAKYGRTWVEQRNLKPRTREHYTSLLEHHIIPTFGDLPLTHITPESVKTWHALMGRAGRRSDRTPTDCSARSSPRPSGTS